MPRPSHLTAAFALSLLAASSRGVRADCTPPSRLSTCIDSDTFWPHAGTGRFAFVGPTDTLAPGSTAFGLLTTYLARPIVLNVPSADPAGTEFEAVGSAWDVTFLGSYGLGSGFEASLAVPFSLYRSGVGISPLTEQKTAPLTRAAMRDVRLGLALRLLRAPGDRGSDRKSLAARVELALPTGDETSFAGDRSLVAIPALSGELSRGIFFAGAELGARLRQVSELAGSRIGPQLLVSLGAGAALLSEDALSVQLEAIALPTTVSQDRVAFVAASGQRQTVGHGPALVPAEWLVSVRTAALFAQTSSIKLGVGGPLELFDAASLTAPRIRVVLSMIYAPRAGGSTKP